MQVSLYNVLNASYNGLVLEIVTSMACCLIGTQYISLYLYVSKVFANFFSYITLNKKKMNKPTVTMKCCIVMTRFSSGMHSDPDYG